MFQIPSYDDGCFHLYKMKESEDVFPKTLLEDQNMEIWFKELSIGDRIKNELSQSNVEVTTKIRIPQCRDISAVCVVEIDGVFHKVYNAYHFRNKDGILETDLTLERYSYEKK